MRDMKRISWVSYTNRYERHEEEEKCHQEKDFVSCKIPHCIFTFYFTIFDLNISNLLQKFRWTPQRHPKARPGNPWLHQEGRAQSSCCTPHPHFHMAWWQHANYKLRHVPAQGMERWLQAPPGKVPTQNTRPVTRIKVEVTKLLQSCKACQCCWWGSVFMYRRSQSQRGNRGYSKGATGRGISTSLPGFWAHWSCPGWEDRPGSTYLDPGSTRVEKEDPAYQTIEWDQKGQTVYLTSIVLQEELHSA